MTPAERTNYTTSVKCLMQLPPKTPKWFAPGVTSRYDDFTAAHINNTLLIHVNGVFLGWHRHFVHLYEKALIEECGYKGAVPYWNWPWWADDLPGSQLFDGSATSLGGDGYWNASMPPVKNGNYTFPRGNGGGCIKSGPFANISTGFRVFQYGEILKAVMPEDALNYAPHCIYRDLNSAITAPNHQPGIVNELISAPTIQAFQKLMDGRIDGTNRLSPHSGGHWSMGTSMLDQFASPSDPAFFSHHGMIDNMWAQWQKKDPANRTFALDGTITTLNNPPSANATVDTLVYFAFLDKPRRLGEVMDTQSEEYCYRYEYDQNATKPY